MQVALKPDSTQVGSQIATLAANTNKAITFPAWANAVHVYNPLSAPVFFKIDGAASIPDKGATLVGEGFFAPGQDGARTLSVAAAGANRTINFMSTAAGDIYYEFWING